MIPFVPLEAEIRKCLARLDIAGKLGTKVIQPKLAEALSLAGYEVDVEDKRELLRSKIAVWRSKDSGEVVPTTLRRLVDIVAYRSGQLAALIEIELDLNDLRLSGVTRRNGHYDVASISTNCDGEHFHSYNSLERMATAAYCWHQFTTLRTYPFPEEVVAKLEAIASDDPAVHNPGRVPLFLVSGSCRAVDHRVLQRRLDSLNATLICATVV
jgi:hypothetical protein